MKVIIGSGKVANIIKNKDDIVLPHSNIEITNFSSVYDNLSKFSKGTTIVNTAAKINLEWCEQNKKDSYLVNTLGAVNVGEVCKRLEHHLVHISSGCIFDGMETEKIYTEEDKPTPAAWYTKTKTKADQRLLLLQYDKITIVRPRQLISAYPYATNMITKFLNLSEGSFIDSKNSLTCIEDMKEMIEHLIFHKHYGIFNLANEGYVSPLQIAKKIKTKLNPQFKIKKIDYEDYVKLISVKRVNTLLSIEKLISTGYKPRSAQKALNWCIENYGKTL